MADFSVNRHYALFCVSAAFPFACSIKLQHILRWAVSGGFA
ncbi:hypothetical protein NEIELOOT_02434 [Neisseria elongata subsp. glycolytica ATCC 29315]|uniref:Uncharacterized protein n=1 Tax=Neisseria elongata subsp. glycolytica ATCC 29315 TaxID=546263 RepID=D4DTM8_NEIEG|nr:hypothetical protein NEIELOOT_02434 [Neisseria elongata subsp. glycolytica ATCC 29315]